MRSLFALVLGAAMVAGFAQPTSAPQAAPPSLKDSGPITAEQKKSVLEGVAKIMKDSAFVPGIDFDKWPEFVKANQEGMDKAANPREFSLAVNKALQGFGASHFVLATPEAFYNRRNRRAMGMGVTVQVAEGGMLVTNVFPGSGAAEAGLQPGDLITQHNGKKVASQPDLAGGEGETAKLLIIRQGKEKKVSVTRRAFSNVRPETISWPAPDTAVIKIWTFDQGYNRENVEKLFGEAAKSKKLILDLRLNPGGAVVNLMHLMGLVMPNEAPVGAFIARTDFNRYKEAGSGPLDDFAAIAKQSRNRLTARKNAKIEPYKGNLAVLVNGGSGSASEIAAAALADLGVPVIGEKSAGAVLASIFSPLSEGFALQFPLMDYVSPSGRRLEGAGVEPLLSVNSLPLYGQKDEAIEKASMLLDRMARMKSGGQ